MSMVAPWHKKLLFDTLKAALPFQDSLRRLKRRISPYGTDAENDDGLLWSATRQVAMLREAGVTIQGANVLEFGSGWHPLVPLVFRMMGARSVTLTDQERLLDQNTICSAARYIMSGKPGLAISNLDVDQSFIDRHMSGVISVVQAAPNLSAAMDRLGFRYLVPFDPAGEPSGAYDAIVSRSVLEHVSPRMLERFTAEFRRLLRPGGAMCHFVDLSDHWEQKDKSISRVNFLKYPDWLFRLTCLHPQNYQNRLRHSEFVKMFERAGFNIVRNDGEIHQPSIEALKTLPLDDRFVPFPHEELATVSAHIVARA